MVSEVEVLDEVIAAVEALPAERLTHGTVVNEQGCMCAIGAYAYQKLPVFRETADKIVDDPSVYFEGPSMSGLAYDLFVHRNLSGDIWRTNDTYFSRGRGDAEASKAAVIEGLQELRKSYAAD